MEILEKVAYMKGLAEGLGLDTKSKEGKLFTIMMDILDDIALELQDLRTGQEDLEDALGAYAGRFLRVLEDAASENPNLHLYLQKEAQ